MRFRLLGPLRVYDGDTEVTIARRRERLLLGLLALSAGRPVAVRRLIELAWEDTSSSAPEREIRVAVSRLRTALSGVRIETAGDGYLLDVPPDSVDAYAFRSEVDAALALPDPVARIAPLRRALGRWDGPLLADVATDAVRAQVGSGLEELRYTALAAAIGAEIDRGRAGDVLAELDALSAAHPTHEPLVALRMRALVRLGRPADAADAYRTLADRLADELGLDPGPAVRALYASAASAGPAAPAPAQLPADLRTFSGRTGALADLDRWFTGPAGRTTRIGVLVGAGGAGKTTLATRWAHANADRFPDGQIWVNLRGHSSGHPVAPAAALAHLLGSLGVDPVPDEPDAAVARFAAEVAGRRVLIVLDNARDTAQVAALLPGDSTATVLVTSRDELAGLPAGARRFALAGLDPAGARDLIGRIAGRDRVDRDPAGADDLARLCGSMPLALCLAAAHLAEHPERSVAEQCALVRRGALLAHGADVTDTSPVRVAFTQSYTALAGSAQRMFQALGLHPGHTVDGYAAAALAGVDPSDATARLAALRAAHLLAEAADGRYEMHDLLRAYARERASELDPDEAAGALRRLYRHQLAASLRAVRARGIVVREDTLAAPYEDAASAAEFADPAEAGAWLRAERANAVALAAAAAGAGMHAHAIALGQALGAWVMRAPHLADGADLFNHLHALSRDLGHPVGQAHALTQLGIIAHAHGRNALSRRRYEEALAVIDAAGIDFGRGALLINKGLLHVEDGEPDAAVASLRAARAFLLDTGRERVAAMAESNLSYALHFGGRPAEAIPHAESALRVFAADDEANAALALTNLSEAHWDLGDAEASLEYGRQAIALHESQDEMIYHALLVVSQARKLLDLGRTEGVREMVDVARSGLTGAGDITNECVVLDILGRWHLATGNPAAAVECHRRSVALADELDAPAYTRAYCANGLALTRYAIGDLDGALAAAERGLADATRSAHARTRAEAATVIARARARLGQRDGAADAFRLAYDVYRRMGSPAAGRIAAEAALLRPVGVPAD